jgi:hypothetical protein
MSALTSTHREPRRRPPREPLVIDRRADVREQLPAPTNGVALSFLHYRLPALEGVIGTR